MLKSLIDETFKDELKVLNDYRVSVAGIKDFLQIKNNLVY